MTIEPLEPRRDEAGSRSRSRRQRASFPLFLKLVLLTSALVIAVVGVAIGITINRANAIATETVNKAISGAAALFKEFERTRLQELSIGAYTLARDVPFVAYVERAQQPAAETDAAPAPPDAAAQAPPAAQPTAEDVVSVLDQLGERKAVLGSDLLIVTDADGVVLARTDEPNVAAASREDLYETQPLVRATVESSELNPLSGVLEAKGKLYHAAVAPLSVGAGGVKSGYIVNAYEIDEAFANRIAKSTQADVIFFPSKRDTSSSTPRSSDAPAGEKVYATGDVARVLSGGRMLPPHQVRLGDDAYLVTGEPLRSRDTTLGAAVFLRSLDRELAPFRAIEKTLLLAGGIALLFALIISWFMSRRLTRPIEELAGFAQAVTEGDYSVNPTVRRSDEVGILAKAFAQMVSSLRDKAELEELYAQMSSREEEREEAGTARPARSEEGTIMVTDLRGVSGVGERSAEEVLALVTRALRIQEAEVERQDGEVREIVGHRLVCTFGGERSILHAIRAARAISEELSASAAQGEVLSVGIGIATGEFVSGSVQLTDHRGTALVGNAPLLALLFAWEAPTGVAFVSLETAQAATTDLLTAATREEIRLRWLPNPVPVISLPLHEINTSVMKSISGGTLSQTAQMPTMRLGGEGSMPQAVNSSADLTPGALFANRYVIESILGRGGMGVVYRATDTQLDETVAIKTLPGDAMTRSTEELERFKREIRLARKITHRNVLRTYDYGEANGVYFISMEYVRGYTLAELLEEESQLAPRLSMSITRQVCRGLQVAHEEGVIHRDIKPQNVLVDQKGQVKLMDFGIARMAESKEAMTSAGLIVGTPHYMSPEQVQGKTLDARSDVYSMGVLIYEMLCGARPFESSSLTGILTAHITERPKPPIEIRPEIGTEINRIVMKCLEKDPARRYADAGELLNDLDRLQSLSAAA